MCMHTRRLKCWHELPGRAEREILSGFRERQQHWQPCWDSRKQRWWAAPSLLNVSESVQNMGLHTCCCSRVSDGKKKTSPSSFALHSEEKIRCRFEVQQPHEHWQEEALLVREPGEMCGHLRWAEIYSTCHVQLWNPKACTDCHSGALLLLWHSYCLFCGSYWMIVVSAADVWWRSLVGLFYVRLNISIFSHVAFWILYFAACLRIHIQHY